jgi:hypothetical protein
MFPPFRMVAPLIALSALTACGDADDSGGESPTLVMTSPADGDTVCGSPLVVEMHVENFTLTNEDMDDPPPNTGHIHVYLNGQEVAQSDQETTEIQNVPDQSYQLKADLALANHGALNPAVGTKPIYITVDSTVCETTK